MKKRNETKDDTNSSVSESSNIDGDHSENSKPESNSSVSESSEIDDDYAENLKSDSEQKISEQGEEMMPIDPRSNYFYILLIM